MAPEGFLASAPLKAIWRQTLRRSSLNATTCSPFDVPATFVQLSRASAKRRVISTTEVIAMAPASGKEDPGGFWEEPRLRPQSETIRFYWS